MSEFIPDRKTRHARKEAAERATTDLVAEGTSGINRFEYVDSALEHGPDNSLNFLTFEDSFHELVPGNQPDLRSYIEGSLQERCGEAIGIEFGGPGVRLFQGFTPGFFRKSIGVTLIDHYRSVGETEPDYGTHKIIEGDMRSDSVYEKIDTELGSSKADLIIERLLSGWNYIENDPVMFGKILEKWYALLSEGGLLFAEAPVAARTEHKSAYDFLPLLEKWQDMLAKQYAGRLNMQIGASKFFGSPVFSLRKYKGAPEKLPLIPIRDLLKP